MMMYRSVREKKRETDTFQHETRERMRRRKNKLALYDQLANNRFFWGIVLT